MNSPASSALKSLRWVPVCQLEESRRADDDDDEGRTRGYSYTGCGPGETYLIQYTSGATGPAKPVAVTAGSAAHNARAARAAYAVHPGSVVASWLPQYHDCGLMFLLLTVAAGVTCVLASPAAFLRRPRLWLELVAEFRATCTPVPSFALPLVLRRGRFTGSESEEEMTRPVQLGSLRNLILINEPIYESSVDEFVKEFASAGLDASAISPSYGLAENCTFVSTAWRGTEPRLPSNKKLLPSARLPALLVPGEEPEIEIVVVDGRTGEPVADGVEGEIWISSPSNASGYLRNTTAAASRDAFCASVPGRPGTSFVRTGDCGVVSGPERYLYVLGRTADAIAVTINDDGQRRVHAHYVETAAFESSPEYLRGGCVAAFATSPSSVAVVAELRKGTGDGADLRKNICDGVRRAVWKEEGVSVGSVVLVESGGLPKTTSGKLRRGLAREKLLAGELPKVFVADYAENNADVSTSTWLRDGSKDKCRTSWVVPEAAAASGELGGMVVMTSGNATISHSRLRLQSSL
ncbi:hypothetical protein PR202_gb05425 [Eleusine coracana subsp. coracana]|uniref:AMP-dependent synthetase/ligase domain-containing protein n=1 Tax=Eleusine coracana subsp. coracana TaxID=191504 RepID=A0AAV5E6Z4_ELECO|nr:hypothetical protein PR202_gb05425 [Eleusine coracana subsp. coracana]